MRNDADPRTEAIEDRREERRAEWLQEALDDEDARAWVRPTENERG